MTDQLTAGICARIYDTEDLDDDIWTSQPILQFVSAKKVNPNGMDRWRAIISDGEHVMQAMLATQLNYLFEEGKLNKFNLIRIEKFTCNNVQTKRIVIILAMSVVSPCTEKIGDPVPFGVEGAGETGAASSSKPISAVSTSAPLVPPLKPPQQQPPQRQAGGPRGGRNSSIYPIEGLSPYTNAWTIKARVTQKTDIKTWSNQRGEGKLFSVTFMDESGEIRATGFNAVVDELYEKLQEGKVYFVSKARVNLAKKKFNNIANEYELNLEKNTEIEECLDVTNVPVIKYNFVGLDGLNDIQKDSTCDVIGIVKEVGDVTEIPTKTQRTVQKRELVLCDRSNTSIRLTLWGKQAEQYNVEEPTPVIAFKGVKVGDFQGRSLSMFSTSTMSVNPDIPEAHMLRGWYDSIGHDQTFQTYSGSGGGGNTFNRAEMRTLNDVKEAELGTSDRADFFSCRATVLHIKADNLAYPACPTGGCNKKVVQESDGWRCEKCDRTYPKPEYRYIISMAVSDYTGQAWLQGFNDVGVAVFGMSADDFVQIKDNDNDKYTAIMAKSSYSTFNFSCRAKQDTYQDQTRVRYGISRILPLDYKAEAGYLRDLLRSSWAK